MKILKSTGPSTDPCGTPVNNSVQVPNEVLIFILCHLLLKYEYIRLNTSGSNP